MGPDIVPYGQSRGGRAAEFPSAGRARAVWDGTAATASNWYANGPNGNGPPFQEQTPTQEMEDAFASLLRSIDQNTNQLVAEISPKDYLAMSQLPLSYPWSRQSTIINSFNGLWLPGLVLTLFIIII